MSSLRKKGDETHVSEKEMSVRNRFIWRQRQKEVYGPMYTEIDADVRLQPFNGKVPPDSKTMVLELLKSDSGSLWSSREISEDLHLEISIVRKALSALRFGGVVEMVGRASDTMWRLRNV